MANKSKETPTMQGEDAKRFLVELARSGQRDHNAEFERAMETFERLYFQEWKPNALV